MRNINSILDWKKLSTKMSRLALEYLLTGADLGDEQSIETLRNYYLKDKKLNQILAGHQDLVKKYSKTIDKIK